MPMGRCSRNVRGERVDAPCHCLSATQKMQVNNPHHHHIVTPYKSEGRNGAPAWVASTVEWQSAATSPASSDARIVITVVARALPVIVLEGLEFPSMVISPASRYSTFSIPLSVRLPPSINSNIRGVTEARTIPAGCAFSQRRASFTQVRNMPMALSAFPRARRFAQQWMKHRNQALGGSDPFSTHSSLSENRAGFTGVWDGFPEEAWRSSPRH